MEFQKLARGKSEIGVICLDVGGTETVLSFTLVDDGLFEVCQNFPGAWLTTRVREIGSIRILVGAVLTTAWLSTFDRSFCRNSLSIWPMTSERWIDWDGRQNVRRVCIDGLVRLVGCSRLGCLSKSPRAAVEIDALANGYDFYISVSRALFEKLCHDLCVKIVNGLVEFERKIRQKRPLYDINHSMFRILFLLINKLCFQAELATSPKSARWSRSDFQI